MSQSDEEDRKEFMQRARQGFEHNRNLSPAEIEEALGYEFVAGPATVRAQVRRYYLKVKDNRPDRAARLLAETERFLSKPVQSEQEVHDLSVILHQYISGFVIYPDLTDEVRSEMAREFPRPLETLTVKADKLYQVWHHGKSNQALWKAWRQGRPTVLGYGMTEERAIDDLRYCVQPDHDGTLDGLGKPQGTTIGGNHFTPAEAAAHNCVAFSGIDSER